MFVYILTVCASMRSRMQRSQLPPEAPDGLGA